MLKKLILISLFVPQMALAAGFSLMPSLGTYKQDSDNSFSQVELRVGYTYDMGLYVGGFYALGSEKFVEDASEYYLGATVGYVWQGLYGLASYIITGDQDLKSGGVKYSSGNGYQFTLGYRLPITTDIYLGPELTLRQVEFDSREVQGLGAPTDREDSLIIPSVAVTFNF